MKIPPLPHRCLFAGVFAILIVAFTEATPVAAQETADPLSLHGYLTQAYGKSDGLPYDGIPKDGTWDYRIIALQMRYAMTDNDQFVVQARDRRLGVSQLSDDQITLDWAYYRHDFGPVSVKVGRVPFSLGLYNEIRLVGTLLPFFRAPSVFYLPGIETIDGVSLSHRLALGAWSLESTPYWGGETVVTPIVTPTATTVQKNRWENIFGTQEWLDTPLQGLRIGGAFHRFKASPSGGTDTSANNLFAGSVDGTFEHVFVRGEYMKYHVANVLPGGGGVSQVNYYGQGGVKLVTSLWLNAQWEVGESNYASFRFRSTDDQALGLSYAVSPELVLKLEAHKVEGYSFDSYVAVTGPPGKANYAIASLSASF